MKYRAVLLGYPYFLDSASLAGSDGVVGLIIDYLDAIVYRGVVDIGQFDVMLSDRPMWRLPFFSHAWPVVFFQASDMMSG